MLAEHDPTSLYLTYEEQVVHLVFRWKDELSLSVVQAKLFQIDLGVMRVRVPECLFQVPATLSACNLSLHHNVLCSHR